jgi:hypothetical protein
VKLVQRSREVKELEARLFSFTASSREMELTYAKSATNCEKMAT